MCIISLVIRALIMPKIIPMVNPPRLTVKKAATAMPTWKNYQHNIWNGNQHKIPGKYNHYQATQKSVQLVTITKPINVAMNKLFHQGHFHMRRQHDRKNRIRGEIIGSLQTGSLPIPQASRELTAALYLLCKESKSKG